MSKTINFSTLTGREFKNILFDIDRFFDYMSKCGVQGIPPENQIILLLNNLFEAELDHEPYDSVFKIEYEFSEEFIERYEMMDNVLKYDL
jgi:hypothetical protein